MIAVDKTSKTAIYDLGICQRAVTSLIEKRGMSVSSAKQKRGVVFPSFSGRVIRNVIKSSLNRESGTLCPFIHYVEL